VLFDVLVLNEETAATMMVWVNVSAVYSLFNVKAVWRIIRSDEPKLSHPLLR
jgi:hypothetical protein